MTSLQDEILQCITEYDITSLDNDINIIRAHMEATMKDIIIQKECKNAGIVMESDIIPERGDENIIKYIFLFIPRLIINVFKKVKAWWEGIRKQALDKVKKELDDEAYEILAGYANQICMKVNAEIRGGGHLTYTGSGFVYLTRVKQPVYVVQTYQSFADSFVKYKDCIGAFGDMVGSDDLHPATTNNKLTLIFEEGKYQIDEYLSDDYVGQIEESMLNKTVSEISDTVDKASAIVIKAMEDVENQYIQIKSIKNLSEDNKKFAEKFMDIITNIESIFTTYDNVAKTDFANAVYAFGRKTNIIDTVLRPQLLADERNDSPTKRKDLIDKMNKWGVK